MNEEPYKSEHLQEYKGILTSHDAQSGKFKMELKVEDNPVLKERWTQKDKSAIELEVRYNGGPSTMFFHNRHTCPLYLENKECRECERIRETYNKFEANLHRLQFGDTFSIQAALINNKQSVLPAEIHDFKDTNPCGLHVMNTLLDLQIHQKASRKNMNVKNSDCNVNEKPKKNARKMKNYARKKLIKQNGEKNGKNWSNGLLNTRILSQSALQ